MMILSGTGENMTEIKVRFKIITPLGEYFGRLDTIPNKHAFQDYVEEATSLIVDAGEGGVANFTDNRGRVVFIMQETLKNSIIEVLMVE